MNAGNAWVVIEEHFHGGKPHLLSIISPRKTGNHIRDFMEQMYVDKFASIDEKITYKKDRKKSPFRIEKYEQQQTTISCGHDPVFRAYYCHKLKVVGEKLTFTYRVFKEELGSRIPSEFEGSVNVT